VESPLRSFPSASLFLVLDGHCGAAAAAAAATLLPRAVSSALRDAFSASLVHWSGSQAGVSSALRKAFLATDGQMSGFQYEGCAATAVLVWREAAERDASGSGSPAAERRGRLWLQAANVGDASAVLGMRTAPVDASLPASYTAVRLTEEHKVEKRLRPKLRQTVR
jgi:protein phosphatase